MSDTGNDDRPPVLQEQEDDENYQQGCFKERHHHFVYGSMNDIRSVQGYIVLYACREILREFLHFCLYSFGNVQRVAARLLIDSDGSGGFPVQLGYYAVRGRAQVDMRHVAQTEYLPSGFGTQDNVAELFG